MRHDFPRTGTRALDVLFVIDGSPSIQRWQPAIRAALDRLVGDLERAPQPVDVHVGVVSSDLGGGGVAGCTDRGEGGVLRSTPQGRRFISWEMLGDGKSRSDEAGPLREAVLAMAAFTTACPVEQPLEAMRRALVGSVAENQGFARAGATRYVVILSDEDDCSLAPGTSLGAVVGEAEAWSTRRCADAQGAGQGLTAVTTYSPLIGDNDLFAIGSGGPEPVVIGGDGSVTPACTADTNPAWPAPRLAAFADAVRLPLEASVCDADLGADLSVLPLFKIPLGETCLEGDTDLETPGQQLDCAISMTSGTDAEHTLKACRSAPPGDDERPCWYAESSGSCPAALRVAHAHAPLPAAFTITARCAQACTAE